jgi:hypothetical protein
MFGPRKRKIADLDVDEVMQAIAPLIGTHEAGQVARPTFAPTVQNEPVNMGFGRTTENVPSGVPAATPTFNPVTNTQPPTFGPRSRQQELDAEYKKNDELHTVGAPKEHSLAKRLLQGALRGFATGGIGGAIAGTAVEGFYPKANTQMRTNSEIAKSNQRIGGLQKAVGAEEDSLFNKARTENIMVDNERQEQIRKDNAEKDRVKTAETKRANFYKQNKYFDPTKATPAQARQLAEFGETPDSVGKFDFSKPEFKQVGEDTFKWDANEQAFVDTNLPNDKTKAFTEITVKEPETKKSYTFVTTQEKAAGLMNARTVAGLQIEAAKDRQISQQKFTREENDKARDLARSRIAIANSNLKLAQERLALAQGDAKVAAEQDVAKAQEARVRLKAYLKNSQYISDTDDIWKDFDALP